MAFTQIKTNLIANSAITQEKIDPLVELGGGSSVTTSNTAPVSPSSGDMWYNTTNGKLFVYYNSNWVEGQSTNQGIGSRVVDVFTASANQVTFTTSSGYTVGYVDVYINGIKILPADFTATNATTVILGEVSDANDEVVIISWTLQPGVASFTSDIFTANGAQTSFTLSTTPSSKNQTSVVIDGVTQVRDTYSVNGSLLTFSETPLSNSVIEVTTARSVANVISYNDLADKPDLSNISAGVKISNIQVTDSGGTVLDDTAVDTAGGYILLTGSGFASGCQVIINNVPATSTTFVNSTTVRAQLPATAAGTYIVYLANTDGSVGIRVNGVTFSASPGWQTSSSLSGNVDDAISIQLIATEATVFALQSGSTLPAGLTLSSGGLISGTITGLAQETVYSFTIIASDAQNQESPRTFSITITVGEQYFNRTVLAINADVGNTFIRDASSNNFPVTIVGDTRPSNFSPYNTNWSNFFDGSGDYLSTPASSHNAIMGASSLTSTLSFTIECWIYMTAAPTSAQYGGVIGDMAPTGTADYWSFGPLNNNFLSFYWYDGSPRLATGNTTISLNSWTHIAVSSNSGALKLFVNGIQQTITGTSTLSNTTGSLGALTLGQFNNSTVVFTGYISNLRIVKQALYSTTFTPSTTPLTAIANTSLLTCQSNRFIDNSTNNFSITRNGDTKVTSFGPFTETDTTTGSAYFDGTGDYLTLPSNAVNAFGTGNFSVEFWYYPVAAVTGTNNSDGLVSMDYVSGFTIGTNTVPSIYFYIANSSITANISIPINQWNHFLCVRTGTTAKIYMNGSQIATGTLSGSVTNSTVHIGTSSHALGETVNGYISNVRLMSGTNYDTSVTTITVPTSPLTAVANTRILTLQNRQPFNNHSFIDTSGITTPMVKVGSSSQGSFSPFSPAGWSNYFDGNGDYLTAPSNAAFTLGSSGNFTIECWFYLTASPSNYAPLMTTWTNSTNSYVNRWGITFYDGKLSWYTDAGNLGVADSSNIALNTWTHVAVVRNGSTITMYKNGVSLGTQTTAQSYTTDNTLSIGYIASGAYITGYISNARIVKGTAVYTSNFTSPTAALTAIANTSLLTCQSNCIKDNSTNNFAITRNGDAAAVNFSPFKPTAIYSKTTHGGSVYFDGDGDYLYNSIANNLLHLNNNFTIEAWVYMIPKSLQILFNTTPHTTLAISLNRTGIGDTWVFVGNGSGSWLASPSINSNSVSKNLQLNSWNHVALVRNGATITLYHNGEVAGTTTNLPSGFSGGGIYIGSYNSAGTFGEYFKGYMSGFRIVNGTAIYTAAFTPPTTPPSNVSGTVMLLNYSDAAIVDVSSRNVMETVADAKIVTSTRKYGTGSMYFDGTGDYLASYSDLTKSNCTFRTGDFTIEAWVNFATVGSDLGIADTATSTTSASSSQWYLYRISTNLIGFGNHGGGAIVSSTTTTLASTWYHVAVTRSGTSLRLFVNGVLESTVTNSTDYIAASLQLGLIGTPYLMNGYIDDFRITKGVARYTANFTPPTDTFLVR